MNRRQREKISFWKTGLKFESIISPSFLVSWDYGIVIWLYKAGKWEHYDEFADGKTCRISLEEVVV